MRLKSSLPDLITQKNTFTVDYHTTNKINKLVIGLNEIMSHSQLHDEVLKKIEECVNPSKLGRPGMNLWSMFVLGTFRIVCNYSYAILYDLVKNHKSLRQLLEFKDESEYYPESTLKDNIKLINSSILNDINKLIVNYGQNKVTNYQVKELDCKTDSFVVLGNIEYPVDTHLLRNVMEMLIKLINKSIAKFNLIFTLTRQAKKFFKKLRHLIINISKSKAHEKNKKKYANEFLEETNKYYSYAKYFIEHNALDKTIKEQLQQCINDAELLMDQIKRRIINDEKIPHEEKIFSIYKRYIEWISKGKVATPVELGLKVCISQDQYGFIIDYAVVQNETDSEMIIEYTKNLKTKYPKLKSNSLDRGYYSKENYQKLVTILDEVILPVRGYKNDEITARESTPSFKEKRRNHPAIESAINGIEQSGLDICRDYGINGFKRHVGFAVIARNIWKIGDYIVKKEIKRNRRLKTL